MTKNFTPWFALYKVGSIIYGLANLLFISDHEALKHIRSQTNLNRRHATWVEFIVFSLHH